MTRIRAALSAIALLAPTVITVAACGQQGSHKEANVQEASANFDLEDVQPFLSRIVPLIDSGFSADQAAALANLIAQQAVDSQRQYEYAVVADGAQTTMRIEVFMDDVDAPDIAFFAHPALAARIDDAMKKYFDDVGK